MKRIFIYIVFVNLIASFILPAKIKLPSIINDHMVIQQNTNIPIWGWEKAGELVKVKGSWMDEPVSTVTDAEREMVGYD